MIQVNCSQLQVGAIMATNEVVTSITKAGKFSNVKALVGLRRPNGSTRLASWGWFTNLAVKSL